MFNIRAHTFVWTRRSNQSLVHVGYCYSCYSCFCWLLFLMPSPLKAGYSVRVIVSSHSDAARDWCCVGHFYLILLLVKMSLSLQMNTLVGTNRMTTARKSAQRQKPIVTKAKLLRKTHPIRLILYTTECITRICCDWYMNVTLNVFVWLAYRGPCFW